MSLKRIIARNAVWSAAGMASGVITGFITAPFLVHRLGQTTYGLWILIASLTSYLNLIDLGLRASITRHVSFFRAKRDQTSVNGILSTAQAILAMAAAVTVIVTFILVAMFARMSEIAPDQLAAARLALVLAGLSVAITLAFSIFDAALWAYERFDLLNSIEITCDVAQTVALLYLIGRGGSLVTVASVVLAVTVLREGAKVIVCLRMDRNLRISPSGVSAWATRRLFGYGLWKFLWSVGNRATSQCGPLIIASRLGAGSVTPYSVASRLVGYAQGISTVATGVVTPTATALHADERHASQQRLFIEGGKYCLTLSLFFVTAIVLLGKPFITFWMGSELALFSILATVLALGEILPMSQWITYSILLGKDRHRVVACTSFVEMVLVVGLGLVLAHRMGLGGVCLAIAIPGMLCRGILPIVYGCRVLDVPVWRYVLRALVPPILAVALPAGGLAVLVRWRAPENWIELFCYGGIFSLGYSIACCAIVVGPEQTRNLVARGKALFVRFPGRKSELVP